MLFSDFLGRVVGLVIGRAAASSLKTRGPIRAWFCGNGSLSVFQVRGHRAKKITDALGGTTLLFQDVSRL